MHFKLIYLLYHFLIAKHNYLKIEYYSDFYYTKFKMSFPSIFLENTHTHTFYVYKHYFLIKTMVIAECSESLEMYKEIEKCTI